MKKFPKLHAWQWVQEAFLTMLRQTLLMCRKRKQEAEVLLIASLHAYPCNWSAWLVGCGQQDQKVG